MATRIQLEQAAKSGPATLDSCPHRRQLYLGQLQRICPLSRELLRIKLMTNIRRPSLLFFFKKPKILFSFILDSCTLKLDFRERSEEHRRRGVVHSKKSSYTPPKKSKKILGDLKIRKPHLGVNNSSNSVFKSYFIYKILLH